MFDANKPDEKKTMIDAPKSDNETTPKAIIDDANEVKKDAYRRGMIWGAALMGGIGKDDT